MTQDVSPGDLTGPHGNAIGNHPRPTRFAYNPRTTCTLNQVSGKIRFFGVYLLKRLRRAGAYDGSKEPEDLRSSREAVTLLTFRVELKRNLATRQPGLPGERGGGTCRLALPIRSNRP